MMAEVIEFYIPVGFRKKLVWQVPEEKGQVIQFAAAVAERASVAERGEQNNYVSAELGIVRNLGTV